ncbi:MAG: hypothetical protein JWN78_10 [Bacteroidota bacterium]|nr:hypothetical protein [Bacteroidota bacterium]
MIFWKFYTIMRKNYMICMRKGMNAKINMLLVLFSRSLA